MPIGKLLTEVVELNPEWIKQQTESQSKNAIINLKSFRSTNQIISQSNLRFPSPDRQADNPSSVFWLGVFIPIFSFFK